jgi:hypothetical protein
MRMSIRCTSASSVKGERKGVHIVLVPGINEGGHSTLDGDADAI